MIPPFQWTKTLSLSVDFESPNENITKPYQPRIGKVSLRATDWTYYHVQDEVDTTEYHPDWPTVLKEMGPIMIPAGSDSSFNQGGIPP